MKKANHYSIFIIGSDFYRIKQAHYFPNVVEIPAFCGVDLILLGTPVQWKEDGRYSIEKIREDVKVLYSKGYSHQICLTRFMPFQETEALGCHYFPLDFIEKEGRGLCFGLNPTLSFDTDLLRSLFIDVFRARVQIMSLKRVETLVLIQSCKNMVDKILVKEMDPFYKMFDPVVSEKDDDLSHEEVSVLTYMIRKLEDIYEDCPVLYSCLFRQKFLHK